MSELQSADMVEKLKDNFDEMVVYKDLKKSNFITSIQDAIVHAGLGVKALSG